MYDRKYRIPLALAVYVGWAAITILGSRLINPGERPLIETVSHGPGWNFLVAILFLAGTAWLLGWRDLALGWPARLRSWLLLWLPFLFIAAFVGLAVALGLPPLAAIFWIGINTAMVGVSEELMFRGVLFRAFAARLAPWPAVLLTSMLFGAIHLLNVFQTGALGDAALQALTAFMSGMLFVAIVIRTGSLLPAMLYHWLWDFGTFMLAGAEGKVPDLALETGPWWMALVPMALVLPNFLYALYLMRRLGRAPA
jgi:membrane protease YdiL (CAAX protease family)